MSTSQADPIPVSVSGVNGVRDLSFSFTEPGVYALRGRNGAGKTSTMQALRAAAGDKRATAEPTDGTQQGTVVLGGVTMIVGQRRLPTGLPSVQLASDGVIGKLIDPGVQDEVAANRQRIDALLSLIHLPADEAALEELTDHDPRLFPLRLQNFPSALELAKEVKRDADRRALECEKAYETRGAEAKVLQEQLLAIPVRQTLLTLDEATAAARGARDRHAEMRARMLEQTRSEERVAEIRKALPAKPADPKQHDADIDALVRRETDLTQQLSDVKREIGRLIDQRWVLNFDNTKWEKQQAALAEAEKRASAERITEAHVLEAEDAATLAQAQIDQVKEAAKRAELVDKVGDAIRFVDKTRETAEKLRKVAKSIPYALGRLLQRAGVPGLTIGDDDMLCVERTDGARVPFATRLSFGERTKLALEIALHSYRARGASSVPCTLALDPEFWLALDAENKATVAKLAQERGVFLLVEEPADGELRMERVTP